MLEYESGHFLEHTDRREQTEELYQVATQILLPPKSLCSFEGGILEVKEDGNTQRITPDEKLWTHVIIPIGLPHSVTEVKGRRVSLVR